MRTPILLALGLAAGAAAAHFLDPESGRKRRNKMRGQAISKVTNAVTPTGKPDDATLAHRVQTEIFRASDAPKGAVSVDVQAGVATLRGEALPPISLFQIGDLYFVRDGHHRVSVAKSLGRDDIDAYVTEVTTRLKLGADLRVSELPLKDHERLFRERVPLDPERRARIKLSDPWDFGVLAEAVEAWGFRLMQERGHYYERAEVARAWFDEEYVPVSELISHGDLVESGETETDAYMRLAADRYLLLRTHEWSDEVVDELRKAEQRRSRRRHRLPPRRPRRWPY
jgi:hypothetical protein